MLRKMFLGLVCLLLGTSLMLGMGSAVMAQTETTVTGTDTYPSDVAAVQAAVNTYDIVKLVGTFNFGTGGTVFLHGTGREIILRGQVDSYGNPLTTIKGGYLTVSVGIKPRMWCPVEAAKYYVDLLGVSILIPFPPYVIKGIGKSDCTPVKFGVENIRFEKPWGFAIWIANATGGYVRNCHFDDAKQVACSKISNPSPPPRPDKSEPVAMSVFILPAGLQNPVQENKGGPDMISGQISITDNKIWGKYEVSNAYFPDAVKFDPIVNDIPVGTYYTKGQFAGIGSLCSAAEVTIARNELSGTRCGIIVGSATGNLPVLGNHVVTDNIVELDVIGNIPTWMSKDGILVFVASKFKPIVQTTITSNEVTIGDVQEGIGCGMRVVQSNNTTITNNKIECQLPAAGNADLEGIIIRNSSGCYVGQNIIRGVAKYGINVLAPTTPDVWALNNAEVFQPSQNNSFIGNNLATLDVTTTYSFDSTSCGNVVKGYTGGNKELVIDNCLDTENPNDITGVK